MLEMFLGSLSRDTFLAEYWGRKFFQSSSQALLDLRLFGLPDFVKIVSFLRPCDARLRLVRDGEEEWMGDFRQEQVFSLLTSALARGMTAALERLDLFWPPVVELCGNLSTALGCPVHANAYLTPAGALGLNPHYDTHDVFVLQLEGEKHWSLGQIEYSLPTERTADGFVAEMRTQAQFRVRPGDVLYVPRGMAHSARSAASHSLHLTIGCIPYTLGDEVRELVIAASREIPALRDSFEPSNETPEARRARISSLLGQMAELVDTGALPLHQRRPSQTDACYRFDDAFARFRMALDIAGISSTTRFTVHEPERIELVREGEGFVLRDGARRVLLDEELMPTARAIIAMPGVFSLKDVPSEAGQGYAIRVIVRLLSSSFLRVVE